MGVEHSKANITKILQNTMFILLINHLAFLYTYKSYPPFLYVKKKNGYFYRYFYPNYTLTENSSDNIYTTGLWWEELDDQR